MYLNRNNCINGYSCSVHLSAHIEEYPGTLATEKEIHAPKFIGYGITAEFHITSHVMATLTYGFSDPEWHIKDTDNNTDLLIIPGMECDLDIKIKPNQYEEMVDLRFLGEGGQYSWHGLPESNLPSTHMDVDIDYTNAFTGEVNHTPYSVYGNEWKTFSITEGVSGNLVYDSGGTIPEGDFSAYVRYSAHTGWQVSNSYRAEAVSTDPYGNTYNHWLQIDSTGNSINIAGEYLRGMTDFYCNVDITDMPTSYKYSLKDRTGLDLSNASFIDVNGKNWTGATSPEICYKGVQTVTARGNWNYTGHTETASPSFDRSNKWDYNDPAPSSLGGISCTNTPVLNSYSITVYDEDTEEETTYLPGRVGIYAPLGSNLDSEGSMSFSYTAQVEIDDFSDGWTMLERTVSKSGFTRAPYTGEHIPEGYNTADYLIPHMPLGNLITLHGAGFTQEEVNYEPNKVSLVIKAKNKSYYYLPVSITNTDIVWDLTYPDPDKYAGSDEGIRYSPDHLPENYEGDEEEEQAPYYIDEEPCQFMLYGPTLFQSISIEGLPSSYTLLSLKASYSETDTYYNFQGEFEQVKKVGKQDIGGNEHPILRNRQGVIAKCGRFIEIPNNQKDITPQGIESWRFPAISQIEGSSGSRLIFPRDDWSSIAIQANTRSSNNVPAPVSNLWSEQAYIGWISTQEDELPKIKPFADTIDLNYFFNEDVTEYKGFIDLGGGWQGFVGQNMSLDIGDETTSDQIQFMTKGQVSHIDLVLNYDNNPINQKKVDTIPGVIMRYCIRIPKSVGKILRNSVGLILRSKVGKILRGNFLE